jgi:hypothetical protein
MKHLRLFAIVFVILLIYWGVFEPKLVYKYLDLSEFSTQESQSTKPTDQEEVGCLIPIPISANQDVTPNSNASLQFLPQLQSQSSAQTTGHHPPCGRLLRSWNQRPWYEMSPLAQEIYLHQSDCSRPMTVYLVDWLAGLGSNLHIWSQALCDAWELGSRIHAYTRGVWVWLDQIHCTWLPSKTIPTIIIIVLPMILEETMHPSFPC